MFTQTPQPMQSSGEMAMVYLYRPLPLPAREVNEVCIFGSCRGLFLVKSEGTDGGMRTYECTLVALCTGLCSPLGNESGNAALFVSGSAKLKGAVCVIDESGNGQRIAVHLVNGIEDGLDHLNGLFAAGVDLLVVPCPLRSSRTREPRPLRMRLRRRR